MTPRAFIQSMFPTGQVNGRGGMEVNGLKKNTVPVNVTILKTWDAKQLKFEERRSFFHVTNGTYDALLRVCTAGPYVDYKEFAVIHFIGETGTEDATSIAEDADRWMRAYTREH